MKKLHLLFAGAFATLALVACSDDELETETKIETDTETDEGNTGDENTGDENTGDEEAPEAYITLSEAELHFGKEGGEATVTVDANYDWDCEYESDWFTVVADINAGTLTVTCDTNETGEVREGTVTVTAGDGEENVAEATLSITQLAFDPESLVLEYTIETGGTEIQLPIGEKDYVGNVFTIDCTVDWGDGGDVETFIGSFPSHTYSEAGTYTVIINGTVELLCSYDFDEWDVINGVDCLTDVRQWGDLGLKSMDSAFYECTNLTSLPEGAGPFSNVTSFFAAFWFCESLTTVPEDIFSGCTAVEDFGYAFAYCTALTTVPDNLFANCPSVKSFEGVLGVCASLETVPVGIFNNNKLTTNFSWVFYDCESLTTVPEDIFSGCTAVEDFGYAFAYCTALTTVPDNLFANCPSVKGFEGVLGECASLETVPVGIFDNNKSVTNFGSAFYDCPKLVGESPYTMIDGNKVHLYERENYPDYFTAPTDYAYCFAYSTGLDDYYSIPSSWGGGASTNSITPQSLNATSPEKLSPSRLGPHRDAATPQGRAARPHPTRK